MDRLVRRDVYKYGAEHEFEKHVELRPNKRVCGQIPTDQVPDNPCLFAGRL